MFQDDKWHFIFDVDGCITPKGELINNELYSLVLSLAAENKVSIVTGSELLKTIAQIGENLVQSLYMCFTCMGNVVYKNGNIIDQNFWYPDQCLIDFLWEFICCSKFPYRTAHHFDLRTGSMNVSVVGRNATALQRQQYLDYDSNSNERLRLADILIKNFNNIEVSIGGNTSIDIYPKNKNKSQIIKHINESKIIFFGDGYGKWGNDQPLFQALESLPNALGHKVDHWQETMQIIQTKYNLFLLSKKNAISNNS